MHTSARGAARAVASVFVVGSLALGLGACSSAKEELDACSLATDVAGTSNEASAVTDSRRLANQFARVDAPAEIKDEWTLFAGYYGKLADALKDVDANDRDGFVEAVKSLNESVDGEQMNAAGRAISDYAAKNCKA